MNVQQFFDNVHFLAYVRLLRQLHELIREGTDESPAGDALRDKMDEPADYLNHDEIDCLNGISADFYTLTGAPLPVSANPVNTRAIESAIAALYEREYTTSLDLIRKHEANLPPAWAAYFRGRIWSEAGESEIGLEFFQRAKDLEPQNGGYAYMWLATLAAVNRDDALSHAEILLQYPDNHPPQLTLGAASIVFESIDRRPANEAIAVIQKLIPVFEDVVTRLEMSGEERSVSVMAGAIGLLSRCHDRLGNVKEAGEWLKKGILRFPNNVSLLIARGVRLYVDDPDHSVRDFKRAIQLGGTEALPFFFLAHFFLTHDQYDRCQEMASRALHLSHSGTLIADCLEWIAISQANMGFPYETVLATFDAAQAYAPENHRIASNRAIVMKSMTAATQPMQAIRSGPRMNWEFADAKSIQSIGSQLLSASAA